MSLKPRGHMLSSETGRGMFDRHMFLTMWGPAVHAVSVVLEYVESPAVADMALRVGAAQCLDDAGSSCGLQCVQRSAVLAGWLAGWLVAVCLAAAGSSCGLQWQHSSRRTYHSGCWPLLQCGTCSPHRTHRMLLTWQLTCCPHAAHMLVTCCSHGSSHAAHSQALHCSSLPTCSAHRLAAHRPMHSLTRSTVLA
jgi:hypothetical protein